MANIATSTQGGRTTMADDLEGALALARRFVTAHHPEAGAALLAGSRTRGEGVASSDHDVVLLSDALPDGGMAGDGAV